MTLTKNFFLILTGIIAGAIGGYLYYHYAGCDGHCLISSNPIISTLYGALLGGLAGNLFQKKRVSEGSS